MFATEQCLLVLSHHPDVWIMAAQYLDQTAKHLTEKAVRMTIRMRFELG
jgi:cleavage stimulation factor subunit 3